MGKPVVELGGGLVMVERVLGVVVGVTAGVRDEVLVVEVGVATPG